MVKLGYYIVEGCRGWEPGRNGGGKCTRSRRREGRRRAIQGAGVERNRKCISQHCAIFLNRKSTQRLEPLRKGAGTGNTRYGKRDNSEPSVPSIYFAVCTNLNNMY